jgi:hypothetical protein
MGRRDPNGARALTWQDEEDGMGTSWKPRASFGTLSRDVDGVHDRALAMYGGMNGDPKFVDPPIAMATLLALITALAIAQGNLTTTRAKGLSSLRNTKRDALWTAMGILRSWVQSLADVLPAEGACSLIEAAGLRVAGTGSYTKALLTATRTPTPGVVHLDAFASLLAGKAARTKRVMYNWQWSGDGGRSWNSVASTPHANTDIGGLALMATCSFRVSATIGKETGPWSQAVSVFLY